MRVERFDKVSPKRAQLEAFDCGEPALNRWLRSTAAENMGTRFAVTHLLIEDDGTIAGYYCLSAGEVRRSAAPPALTRRAPDPIPVVRMGRFAIDQAYQGQGWGAQLLREALLQAVSGGNAIAARALLVDAISEDAQHFYKRFGFEESPTNPLQVLYDLRVIEASTNPHA